MCLPVPTAPVLINVTLTLVSDGGPISDDYKQFSVKLINAFSNMTGKIAVFQVVVSMSNDAALTGGTDIQQISTYWAGSKGTSLPYIAVEAENFDELGAARQTTTNRRKRRDVPSTVGDSYVLLVIGNDDKCDRDDLLHVCNGNVQPESSYYVLVRACNELRECTSTPFSHAITTGEL